MLIIDQNAEFGKGWPGTVLNDTIYASLLSAALFNLNFVANSPGSKRRKLRPKFFESRDQSLPRPFFASRPQPGYEVESSVKLVNK